jgi:hypothetical protein
MRDASGTAIGAVAGEPRGAVRTRSLTLQVRGGRDVRCGEVCVVVTHHPQADDWTLIADECNARTLTLNRNDVLLRQGERVDSVYLVEQVCV